MDTKLTLEKSILPPLLPGFKPQPFDHKSSALVTSYPGSKRSQRIFLRIIQSVCSLRLRRAGKRLTGMVKGNDYTGRMEITM